MANPTKTREQFEAERLAGIEEANRTARAFFDKYALGPLAAPSCLCCGHLTPHPAAVQHMELPGIVVCSFCKRASEAAYAKANGTTPGRPGGACIKDPLAVCDGRFECCDVHREDC